MLNPCVTVKFGRISGTQIRQKIFKCFAMQICRLFFTAFWNFWRITRFSTTNHRWIINIQTGPVFLAHPAQSTYKCPIYGVKTRLNGAHFVYGIGVFLCNFLDIHSSHWTADDHRSHACPIHQKRQIGLACYVQCLSHHYLHEQTETQRLLVMVAMGTI